MDPNVPQNSTNPITPNSQNFVMPVNENDQPGLPNSSSKIVTILIVTLVILMIIFIVGGLYYAIVLNKPSVDQKSNSETSSINKQDLNNSQSMTKSSISQKTTNTPTIAVTLDAQKLAYTLYQKQQELSYVHFKTHLDYYSTSDKTTKHLTPEEWYYKNYFKTETGEIITIQNSDGLYSYDKLTGKASFINNINLPLSYFLSFGLFYKHLKDNNMLKLASTSKDSYGKLIYELSYETKDEFNHKRKNTLWILENGFVVKQVISPENFTGDTITDEYFDYSFEPFSLDIFKIPN